MRIGRIPSHRYSICYNRLPPLFQCILHHTSIMRIIQCYHCLNTCISQILQLLIIRTIHVGFIRTQPGCSPSYLQYILQIFILRCHKTGFSYKRISRISAIQILNDKRFIFRLNPYIHISPSTPPQISILPVIPTVTYYFILVTYKHFSIQLIPVVFSTCSGIRIIGLRVTQTNFRPSSPAKKHRQITGSQLSLIQYQMNFAICRNSKCLFLRWEFSG